MLKMKLHFLWQILKIKVRLKINAETYGTYLDNLYDYGVLIIQKNLIDALSFTFIVYQYL